MAELGYRAFGELGVGEAHPENVAHQLPESLPFPIVAVVEPEHLFIDVGPKVLGGGTNVGRISQGGRVSLEAAEVEPVSRQVKTRRGECKG